MEFILSCSTRYLTYSLGSEKREIPYLRASNYYFLDAQHKKRTVRKKIACVAYVWYTGVTMMMIRFQFSIECHKTKTKVITLVSQESTTQNIIYSFYRERK